MTAYGRALRAMLLAFVLLSYTACSAEDFYRAEGGPSIFVTSASSNVETGKMGSVFVEIENRGQVTGLEEKRAPETEDEKMLALLEGEMEMEGSQAVGIEARLYSRDERLEVLSRSQMAGSLSAGERLDLPMEFSVRAEESASAGIYPMVLEVSYERLEDVQVTGNPLYPEIYFQRAATKETISIEVPVMTGARLVISEVKGSISPGRSSDLDMIIANSGDLPAREVQARFIVQPPFNSTGEELALGDIEPGKKAIAEFPLEVDREADPGEYALVCQIQYISGDRNQDRKEDLAALVEVKAPTGLRAILIIPIVAIVLTLLYLGGAGKRLRLPRIRRKRRW
ncbi:COG1361 S-layer family protein [Methanocrinis sp.]|uniref:COG1361 S-layer family protein n=1 Tax=Methanocrinis sp. TaxID=3101522 RepID=UPI003D11FC3E